MTVACLTSTQIATFGGALFYYIKDGHVETENLFRPLNMRYVTTIRLLYKETVDKILWIFYRTDCHLIRAQ